MRKITCIAIICLCAICSQAILLKEVYDNATAQEGFDKYLILETGQTYTGGLYIGKVLGYLSNELDGPEGIDVFIEGNGAIIDLQGQEICISYVNNQMSITDCIIINGNVRYRGIDSSIYTVQPVGTVSNVTFYKPQDYGVRITGCGEGITITNNIIVDAVNTGNDFNYITGETAPFLITGSSVSMSLFGGIYGIPVITGNWSYHSDPVVNADSLMHFSAL